MRRSAVVVVLALVLAASGSSAQGSTGSAPFRLLVESEWSGTGEIYAADPSGGRPMAQLTFGRAPTCDQAPCGYGEVTPSPDGRLIIFTDWAACGSPSTAPSLFVALADGTGARVLAALASIQCSADDFRFSWSPDSEQVAYAAPDRKIHTVRVDGSSDRVIGRGDHVSWSPDGTSIAFFQAPDQLPTSVFGPLYVRRNGRTRVVALAPDFDRFNWSPNGRWLAYSASISGGSDELDIVRADGSGRRILLTVDYLADSGWSADSRFVSVDTLDGSRVFDVASGSSRVVTSSFTDFLAWGPHGHALAAADRDGISIVNAATGASRVHTTEVASGAAWSPDGTLLAYIRQTGRAGYYLPGDLRVVTLGGRRGRSSVRPARMETRAASFGHGCRMVRTTGVRSLGHSPSCAPTA